MAVELPGVIVKFLNIIGIPWINVNEDKVRDFATHVRTFASNLSGVHQDATATISQLTSGYHGAASEALTKMWGSKSTVHISEVVDGCGVLATALDAGADAIEAAKGTCIGEMIGMAGTFLLDQGAAFFTFGASEAALPGIEEAAVQLIKRAEKQIEQTIVGDIANTALQPLIGKIDNLVQGLVFGGGGGGSAGSGFEADPSHLEATAQRMRGHADTLNGHVSTFTSNLSSVDFSS